jgi:hypothetical protein
MSVDSLIQVHDFDVLADELPGDVYDMDDFKKQIGNNRFDVLIHMYQESFNKNYTKNNQEECEEIVQKIVDVTCHKSSTSLHNQGRFLVKPLYSVNEWRQLNDEECKQFVRQMLRAPTIEEEEIPDQSGEEEDLFAPLPVTSKIDLGKMDIPSSAFGNMELNDTKKRGRRQSLLRRSASESTMMLDKKKGLKNLEGELYRAIGQSPPPPPNATLRRYHSEDVPDTKPLPVDGPALRGLHRFKSVSDLPPPRSLSDTDAVANKREHSRNGSAASGTIAHAIEKMDVVLNGDRRSFSSRSDIIGNNRLRVMLTLEERKYLTLSPEEQTDAASNLVKAVTVYWGGRILADKEFAYEILTHDESVEALKYLLSSSLPSQAAAQEVIGHASVTSSLLSKTTSKTSSSVPLLAAAPPIPEFLRNASREILNSGKGSNLAGPEQMQSAAVRSIKERAGKRQMAKEAKGSTRPANSKDSAKTSTGSSVAVESATNDAGSTAIVADTVTCGSEKTIPKVENAHVKEEDTTVTMEQP